MPSPAIVIKNDRRANGKLVPEESDRRNLGGRYIHIDAEVRNFFDTRARQGIRNTTTDKFHVGVWREVCFGELVTFWVKPLVLAYSRIAPIMFKLFFRNSVKRIEKEECTILLSKTMVIHDGQRKYTGIDATLNEIAIEPEPHASRPKCNVDTPFYVEVTVIFGKPVSRFGT